MHFSTAPVLVAPVATKNVYYGGKSNYATIVPCERGSPTDQKTGTQVCCKAIQKIRRILEGMALSPLHALRSHDRSWTTASITYERQPGETI